VVTLDHLILTVNNRDASIRFYTEVMGLGHEGGHHLVERHD
jgi:catechol 2,3-dioxygenase-like lactoylglutathione lyase family enzyme